MLAHEIGELGIRDSGDFVTDEHSVTEVFPDILQLLVLQVW